ncbi:MAG: hypothetical protein D6795_09660, partial [Deltaproteobacteria bacterium]
TSNMLAGTRLLLYPISSGRHYAIGIENNHMWFNTDSGYKFYQDSALQMIIASGGNVGLGTASPADKLHVVGNVRANRFSDTANATYYLDPASTGSALFLAGEAHVGMAANNDDDYLYFDTGTAEWLRWDDNPGQFEFSDDLLVSGNLTVTGSINGSGSGNFIKNQISSAQAANFWIAGEGKIGSNLVISGSVGIGTATPTGRLEVVGTMAVTGNGDFFLSAQDSSPSNLATISSEGGGRSLRFKARAGDHPDLVVATTGRIGVGTASPSQALHVAGNLRVTGAYYDSSNAAGTNGQILQSTGSGTKWVNPGTLSGSYILNQFSSAQAANFYIAGKGRVNGDFYALGKVGIGTAAPSAKLEVTGTTIISGSGDFFINAQDSSPSNLATISSEGGSRSLRFKARAGDHPDLVVATTGRIGVGTASPSQALHVVGNLRVTGAYYDSSNAAGTNGQVLLSTGSGTKWADVSSVADSDWIVAGTNMYATVSGNVGIGT